jgi:hypothetical protein
MAANGIFQFKQPLCSHYRGTAKKYLRLNAYILHLLGADHFVDIDPQEAVLPIFHTHAQRANVPVCAAKGNDIHRTYCLFHTAHLPFSSL